MYSVYSIIKLLYIKVLNNIFYKNNKTENKKELQKEKCIILDNIYDMKTLNDDQVHLFKSFSKNSLLEILDAFNSNQKNILEILEESINNELTSDENNMNILIKYI